MRNDQTSNENQRGIRRRKKPQLVFEHTHTHTQNVTVLFMVALIALDLSSHEPCSRVPFSDARVPRSSERSRFRPMPPVVQHVPFIRTYMHADLFTSYVFRRLSLLHEHEDRSFSSLLFFFSLVSFPAFREGRERERERRRRKRRFVHGKSKMK